uniref:Putative VRR-NUC domain-containing protein n=1 Tax=viral metagenome TaxID=1070528 RepID=A0A6M3LMV4_9ZZZZ
MTEAEFTRTVLDTLHAHGYIVAHFRSVPIQGKGGVYYATPVQGDEGFPDIVAARDTRPPHLLFLELKVGRNKCSPAQEEWLKVLNRKSSPALVVRPENWQEFVRLLE